MKKGEELLRNSSSIPRPRKSFYRRFKTPTVIQMEVAECGAAALTIILNYYGSFIALEEVREMCSVSRDGSNALKIIQAAEYYGLNADGFSAELEDLYQASLPLIAFWNFDHFIIIEGFSKNEVFINDPESGPRTITYEELNQSFTGIILTFSPSEQFHPYPKDDKKKWLSSLWDRFKFFKTPLIFSFIIGSLTTILLLGLTTLSQMFIDQILIGKFYSRSNDFFITFSLFILFITVMRFFQEWILARFSIAFTTLLSSQFVQHILRLPLLFFMQRYGGEIASRFNLNASITQALISGVLPALINIVTASLFACVMLFYDITITSIGIIIVLLNLFLMNGLYQSRKDCYAHYRQIQGRLSSFTLNALNSIDSLKAVGGEYQFVGRYGGLYAKSLQTLQNIAHTDLVLGTLSPFLSTVGSMTVLILGSLRILQGYMTVGEFVALQMLFNNFTTPAMSLINLNQTLQLLQINSLRIDDVMRHPEDPQLKSTPKNQINSSDLLLLEGKIEIKNLAFGFSPLDSPLLKNIDITIAQGMTVALVGPSGCGKSTLVRLIGGLLSPREGEILFDEIPRNAYSTDMLTRSIGIVEQSAYLFEGSIEQNIHLMGNAGDQEEMIQAAKDACMHDEIIQRPGGYQSIVEREGANFSGGQRQRLEIASVLSRNPSILILDEATSAVDSLTERRILNNIRKRGKTCLVITHRLNTIIDADWIIVMDKGEIVQEGIHKELIQQTGIYQSLFYSAEMIGAC